MDRSICGLQGCYRDNEEKGSQLFLCHPYLATPQLWSAGQGVTQASLSVQWAAQALYPRDPTGHLCEISHAALFLCPCHVHSGHSKCSANKRMHVCISSFWTTMTKCLSEVTEEGRGLLWLQVQRVPFIMLEESHGWLGPWWQELEAQPVHPSGSESRQQDGSRPGLQPWRLALSGLHLSSRFCAP